MKVANKNRIYLFGKFVNKTHAQFIHESFIPKNDSRNSLITHMVIDRTELSLRHNRRVRAPLTTIGRGGSVRSAPF